MITKIQKKIADRFMCMAIKAHIKREYLRKGIRPTTEQVMQNIKGEALNTLLQQGYTTEEITGMVEKVIGRLTK